MTDTSNATGSLVQQDQNLLNGVQKNLTNQSFTILDQSYTVKQVITLLQGRISKGQAVIAARAALKAAMQDYQASRAQTNPSVSAFRAIVKGMYQNPSTLADFGLSPRKSTKKTLKTKVAAVAQIEATREARGTTGPKAKAKIKGTVTTTAPATKPATPGT